MSLCPTFIATVWLPTRASHTGLTGCMVSVQWPENLIVRADRCFGKDFNEADLDRVLESHMEEVCDKGLLVHFVSLASGIATFKKLIGTDDKPRHNLVGAPSFYGDDSMRALETTMLSLLDCYTPGNACDLVRQAVESAIRRGSLRHNVIAEAVALALYSAVSHVLPKPQPQPQSQC